MSDYQNYTLRLPDAGLTLVLPPDITQVGNWTRLHNTRSTYEGFIATRPGCSILYSPGVATETVHSLQRLDETTLLVGVGHYLAANGAKHTSFAYSGDPLTILPYRPADATTAWAYIADSSGMRKVRADGTDYRWGIAGPGTPCTVSDGGAGVLDSSGSGGIAYEYIYAYRCSSAGCESNPSKEMPLAVSFTNRQARVTVQESTDVQVDQIALYRKGGYLADFHLVDLYPNATQDILDNHTDGSIVGNETIYYDSYLPFTVESGASTQVCNTPYVWGPFNGNIFLACGIPTHPGYVFWLNPGAPDGMDIGNLVEVTNETLLNGWIYGTSPYAVSRDNVYALQFGSSEIAQAIGLRASFQGQLTPVGRGLSAPWAFAVGPYVWFLSKDEIVQTDCASPAVSISDSIRPIFFGKTVENFKPVSLSDPSSLRLCYYGRELHFFYLDTSGDQQHLIYDTQNRRWRSSSSTETDFVCGYDDENQSSHRFLLGGGNGKVYYEDYAATTDNGKSISWEAQTGALDFETPNTYKEVGGVILDAKGTIAVTPLTNFNQTSLTAHSSTGASRSKRHLTIDDEYTYTFGLRFAGTGAAELHNCDVLWRVDEEDIKHWEFPETSHGIDGWQHIRDGYIALRSTTDVTLTIVVDGTSCIYTLASTAGKRRKVRFDGAALKGKMFQYKLDSASVFRVYGEDCEMNIKQWNVGKGYATISPFDKTQGSLRRMGE